MYAVDDQHLFIRNFRYEQSGPDAYFWVGNTNMPDPYGQMVPYPPTDETLLGGGGAGLSTLAGGGGGGGGGGGRGRGPGGRGRGARRKVSFGDQAGYV